MSTNRPVVFFEDKSMLSLTDFSQQTACQMVGVLADIDDTITTDGKLLPDAYAAMARIQAAGLLMIPITGRPAGWCDHIARMWPVDGVVGENGAFYFRYDQQKRKFIRRFETEGDQAELNRRKLKSVAERVLAEVSGTALASDQAYRVADIAIDFREDVDPLPQSSIDKIVAIMTEEGLTAKVSSIHVNGWFGSYDKLTMTRTMMAECFSIDIDQDRGQFVFAGDSPNDQPMFEFFPHSVGVSNILNFKDQLTNFPTYVTAGEGGAGFAELADVLIKARSEANV
jgi:HAD superfamily hydrolase (TIGR01484 family)